MGGVPRFPKLIFLATSKPVTAHPITVYELFANYLDFKSQVTRELVMFFANKAKKQVDKFNLTKISSGEVCDP
jgi:hypothetical protein